MLLESKQIVKSLLSELLWHPKIMSNCEERSISSGSHLACVSVIRVLLNACNGDEATGLTHGYWVLRTPKRS